jgi:hypothetical protein
MPKQTVRRAGVIMSLSMVIILLVVYATAGARVVQAAACCQECEAMQMACYASCEANNHNNGANDSLNACLDACELESNIDSCNRHCVYCQYGSGTCYQYDQWDTMHWEFVCQGDTCTYTVVSVDHFFLMHTVGSGYCS